MRRTISAKHQNFHHNVGGIAEGRDPPPVPPSCIVPLVTSDWGTFSSGSAVRSMFIPHFRRGPSQTLPFRPLSSPTVLLVLYSSTALSAELCLVAVPPFSHVQALLQQQQQQPRTPLQPPQRNLQKRCPTLCGWCWQVAKICAGGIWALNDFFLSTAQGQDSRAIVLDVIFAYACTPTHLRASRPGAYLDHRCPSQQTLILPPLQIVQLHFCVCLQAQPAVTGLCTAHLGDPNCLQRGQTVCPVKIHRPCVVFVMR